MQLNAFFPSLDIGSDPAKIRDWAQAAEDLGYAYIDLRTQLGHLPKCEKCQEQADAVQQTACSQIDYINLRSAGPLRR
jgi:hypothetical protein